MRMNPALAKWSERGIGAFKYLISGYMMLVGALTPFAPPEHTAHLSWLYATHAGLFVAGVVIFLSGAALMYGKVRRSKRWVGKGLMYVYMCFVFATLLNFVAYNGDWTVWVGNAIVALITGALWLRWKFKTQYINKNHFKRDIEELTKD
jgi:peptidoglycan/LPS O-acetylase OafA/YrhL